MRHRVAHDLPLDLARRAARAALAAYRERFSRFEPGGEWVDDDHATLWFRAGGMRLAGSITVEADGVVLELGVPLLFRPLRDRAIRVVEEEVRRWIDLAARGEVP